MTENANDQDAGEQRERITEVGVGITLVGVIVNMGLTLGFGLSSSPLYVWVPIACGGPIALLVVMAYLTRRMDLLRTIPWWMTAHGPDPWEMITPGGDSSPDSREQ